MSSIVVPHPSNTPGMFALAKPLRPPHRGHQRPQSPRCGTRSRIPRPPTTITLVERRLPIPPSVDQPHGKSKAEPQLISQVTSSPPSTPKGDPVPPEVTSNSTPTAAHATGRSVPSRRSRHKSTHAAIVPGTQSPSPETTGAVHPPPPVKQLLPSAPIAVPNRRAQTPPRRQMARSDPSFSKLTINTGLAAPKQPRKDKRRKNKPKPNSDSSLPLAEWDFPAPSNSDDEADGDDDEPSTPVRQTGRNDRSWLDAFNDGPKTAPLQSAATQSQFPFSFPNRSRTKTPMGGNLFASVTPPRLGRPEHRRAPSQPASLSRATGSDGIFQFSEDEGGRSTPSTEVRKKMALLFGSTSLGTPSPASRKTLKQRER